MATLPIASLYYSPPLLIPFGTRQHKTRNPRCSSKGCVRISDIIKAVSHAWKRAGCCVACTHATFKKKKKRKMVDPCNDGGKKQEGALEENKNPPACGFLEFLLKWEREWIIHHRHVPVKGDRTRRFREVTLHKPRSKAEGREGGSLELFLTSSFLSMWETVNL